MRNFVRDVFSFLLFIFLLAGCVHNIYHFQKINKHNNYNQYRYIDETPIAEDDEMETKLENEVVITPNHNSLNNEIENNVREKYYEY